MENNYLIPANANRGRLIVGIFRPIDLAIFGTGCGLTLAGLLLLQNYIDSIAIAILIVLPALITGFLVLPIPNQHNILVFLQNMFKFFDNKAKYRYLWKGWCVDRGEEQQQKRN